jgi:hypothetical protein
MPSHSTDETLERLPIRPPASFEFSANERACIVHLIGHKLERIERELILQTLRCKQGNRTLAAKILWHFDPVIARQNSELQIPGRKCAGTAITPFGMSGRNG